jgi:hypothetical protein
MTSTVTGGAGGGSPIQATTADVAASRMVAMNGALTRGRWQSSDDRAAQLGGGRMFIWQKIKEIRWQRGDGGRGATVQPPPAGDLELWEPRAFRSIHHLSHAASEHPASFTTVDRVGYLRSGCLRFPSAGAILALGPATDGSRRESHRERTSSGGHGRCMVGAGRRAGGRA